MWDISLAGMALRTLILVNTMVYGETVRTFLASRGIGSTIIPFGNSFGVKTHSVVPLNILSDTYLYCQNQQIPAYIMVPLAFDL